MPQSAAAPGAHCWYCSLPLLTPGAAAASLQALERCHQALGDATGLAGPCSTSKEQGTISSRVLGSCRCREHTSIARCQGCSHTKWWSHLSQRERASEPKPQMDLVKSGASVTPGVPLLMANLITCNQQQQNRYIFPPHQSFKFLLISASSDFFSSNACSRGERCPGGAG